MVSTVAEAKVITEILQIFGDAASLRTNLTKCSITPIYALDDNL
jgi:hypothetical protein